VDQAAKSRPAGYSLTAYNPSDSYLPEQSEGLFSRFKKLVLWKKILLIAAVVAALALLVFFGIAVYKGARVVWGDIKEWQADRLAELSRKYSEEGKWDEAAISADTALRLDPAQPEATRLLAGLMEAEGRWEQAMELYARLYNSRGATLEDLKKLSINAARGEYTDPARFFAEQVAKSGEPEFPLLLDAEILAKNGDLEGARAVLRQALDQHKSRTARAAMMRFLLTHPGKQDAAELRETVLALKDGTDGISLEALAVGLAGGLAPVDQRAAFVAKIRAHPKRTERILLLADSAELALDPASKPRVVEGMTRRLKGGKLEDRLAGAMWLNSQGQPREALELIPPQDAISNAAAMRAWLDSAAALGEWKAMQGVLARKDVPLPPHMVRVYAARALKMDGRPAEADAAYRAALVEFRDKPVETLEVLEYLHRSGEYAIFDEGLKPQLAKPGEALDMIEGLMPVLLDARDSARLRQVLELAVASPNLADVVPLMNDMAYLDLVLGRPVDSAALRERFRRNPKDPAALFNVVLERLRLGKPREALAILEKAGVDPATLAPNHLTVLACVLAANGKPEESLRVAERIPATRISNQELEMLKGWLAKPAR